MIETLSMLIHADSKVGKTTVGSTSPTPILALDAEGGWKFLPVRSVQWNPLLGPPPAADGTWDVCLVTIREWQTVDRVFQWLQSGQHHFRSLVVDSITEIQRRLKSNLVGMDAPKMQDWGKLLNIMDATIRGFRDLTMHPTNPIQVVIFIAETRQNPSGKWIPTMQGQISSQMPYWVDITGYLYVQPIADANGQLTGTMRRMLIAPNAQYEAGERVQGRLGTVVDEPNVVRMLTTIYPNLQPQAT